MYLKAFLFVCSALFSIGMLSELFSIFELCLKNRPKKLRTNKKSSNYNEVASSEIDAEGLISENSMLYNFSDDSFKLASRSSQNLLEISELIIQSDETLNLIKSENSLASSLCVDSSSKYTPKINENHELSQKFMTIGYESNINVIKYHPFDFQSGSSSKFNQTPNLSVDLNSK